MQEHYGLDITQIDSLHADSFEHDGNTIMMNDFLKQFTHVHFSRTISRGDDVESQANRLKNLGIKIILDVDDYWHYSKNHLYFKEHINTDVSGKCIASMKLADVVVCTTPYLRDKIYEYNKNVFIVENAIDPLQPQFETYKKTPSELVRFGFLGSSCHTDDIVLLADSFKKLYDDRRINNFQICLGGFVISPQNKYVHLHFESIFTDKYKCVNIDKDYLRYLKSQTNDKYPDEQKIYRRIWHTNEFSYAQKYREIDVSLIPLATNEFNSCKSELKMIEAGFMRTPCIVSNTKPYDLLITKDNCVTVNNNDNLGWYRWMKILTRNEAMRKDLSDALYESVKDKYNIKTTTSKLIQLYE